MIIGAYVCEHGYSIAVRDRAVRHQATGGVCIDFDAKWRRLRVDAAQSGAPEPTIEDVLQ